MPFRLEGPQASNHQPAKEICQRVCVQGEKKKKKAELIEFQVMKRNNQMHSCRSAVTLYWQGGVGMKCTSGHLQGGG